MASRYGGFIRSGPSARLIMIVAVLVVAMFAAAPPTTVEAAGGKYDVNSLLDTPDADVSDNLCLDATGNCTLRAAIQQANAHAGKDTISFSGLKATGPAPWTISPATALPTITGPVIIDALKSTGASCKTGTLSVILDGSGTPASTHGLHLSGPDTSSSQIKGLVIVNFPGNGILIQQASKVSVQCNLLGIQQDGSITAGNHQAGVEIRGGAASADNNIIGGSTALRNVISGNSGSGVLVTGPAAGNKIQANYIGATKSGTGAAGNGSCGVWISGATATLVGGSTKVGNVISGNGDGVCPLAGSNNTLIQGNMIGVDATGLTSLGNSGYGINAGASTGVVIGGKMPSYTNVISGNSRGILLGAGTDNAKIQGNMIGVNKLGAAALSNTFDGIRITGGNNSLIGGASKGLGNVISGNDNGIAINCATCTNHLIQGNLIGTDKTGYIATPNHEYGVVSWSASGNTIGGSVAAARNVISGNGYSGIAIIGSDGGNVITGNYIGVNATATAAIGNGSSGVMLDTCTGCRVGSSTSTGERNIISGNLSSGVYIHYGSGNEVFGNYIGTNSTGTGALPNQSAGVDVSETTGNFIGSGAAGPLAGNLVSGNTGYGISVYGGGGNTVQGNIIGLNAAGTSALGNDSTGIAVSDSPDNLIGGVGAGYRNVVSGNTYAGISIGFPSSTNNEIQGNFIGLNAAGTSAIGNGSDGITVNNAASNVIGGSSPGEGNIVSGNSGNGIYASNLTNIAILGNLVGLDASGTKALGNTATGIYLFNNTASTIGGPGANDGNVVSGNGNGIALGNGTSLTVRGNKIGTNSAGTAAIPNTNNGLSAGGASNVFIGVGATGGNLISGNGSYGINLTNSTGVFVQGNHIGTDVSGVFALGNGQAGVYANNTPVLFTQNVIAFNKADGIYMANNTLTGGGASNCLFYNLSGYGMTYSHTANTSFTNNWWGSASGPGLDPLNPGRQAKVDYNTGVVTVTPPHMGSAPAGINCPVGTELGGSNRDMTLDSDSDGVPDNWTGSGVSTAAGEGLRTDSYHSSPSSLRMVGGGTTKVTQTVTVGGSNAGHSIILGFYTRGVGVTGSGLYQASVKVGKKIFVFNVPVDSGGSTGGWVHHTLNFTAPADFTTAVITLTYGKKYGSVRWDDISLMDVTAAP